MSPPPPIRCIILDFDGTFTDVEAEAIPFLASYREGLAERVGAPIDEAWDAAVAQVRAEPDAHGFEHEGRIVAPSHADPYILAASVANLVLSGASTLEPSSRRQTLDELFRISYAQSDTVFRREAKAVIEAILELGLPVFVVSNSHTEHVEAKLETLAPRGLERLAIRGGARKFALVEPAEPDPRFDAVEHQLRVEGLDRPVYLRRGRYFEALRRVWSETGVEPSATFVCGDIFELDLALPARLGASTHLVTRPRTPRWERDAIEAAGGTWSEALTGALDAITAARSRPG